MYLILWVPFLSPPPTLMSTFTLYLSLGHLHHLTEGSRSLDQRDQNSMRHAQSLQGTQENCDPRVTCKLQRRMRTSPRQGLAPPGETKQQKAEGWAGQGLRHACYALGWLPLLVPRSRRNQPILWMNDLPPQKKSLSLFGGEG